MFELVIYVFNVKEIIYIYIENEQYNYLVHSVLEPLLLTFLPSHYYPYNDFLHPIFLDKTGHNELLIHSDFQIQYSYS